MSGNRGERIETPAATDSDAGFGCRPLLTWPFVLLVAAIVALTLGSIIHNVSGQRQQGIARLQAITTVKVDQLSAWLREREGDARLLRSSRNLADLFRRWRDTGDSASREELLRLAVTDDGVGLPSGLDLSQSDTLGLQLVAGLTQQLGGAAETRSDAGTVFRVTFPAPRSSEVLPS